MKNRRSHFGSPSCESRSRKPNVAGIVLTLFLSLWMGGAGAANAAHWVMTDLTPGASNASATLINNRGRVVGSVNQRPFVWENGKLRYLSGRGESASASAINDRGQIVGWTSNESGGVKGAVVWSPTGKLSRLPGGPATAAAINEKGVIAGNASSGVVTWAGGKIRRVPTPRAPNGAVPAVVAINAAGDIIGNAVTDNPSPMGREVVSYGFIRRSGNWVLVGTSTRGAQVNALNDHGKVVGWRRRATPPRWQRAFLWTNGKMTMLGAPPGTVDASTAIAINTKGQIAGEAGSYSSSTGYLHSHGFIWQHGTSTALGSLFRGGESYVTAISDRGQVVGRSLHWRTGRERAFIWAEGRMTNLGATACLSSHAYAINDLGQIVGDCERTKGRRHAVLWTLQHD